ncbi:MAG: spore germination protein [Bacillota bacterium]
MNKLMQSIFRIMTFRENPSHEEFILKENSYDQQSAGGKEKKTGQHQDSPVGHNTGSTVSHDDADEKSLRSGKRSPRPPRKITRDDSGAKEFPDENSDEDSIKYSLSDNRKTIERIYGVPVNKDLIIREFTLGSDRDIRGFAVFIDGLVNRAELNSLLESIMMESGMICSETASSAPSVMKDIIPGSQVKITASFNEVTAAVNYGDTAFFFDRSPKSVLVETKGWEHRNVNRPYNEQTINGPQEAFTETLRANTALIRKIIRSEKLFTEIFKVGTRFRSDVAVMYMKDIADPGLVDEVKRRITGIKVDFITDTGMLEQFIEDSPYNLNPQSITTERPDRVASFLAEGRVAVLLSGSPFVLVLPGTMYSQLHTGEETYLRWQFGTFIRYVRTISFYIALLFPGIYLAVVLYHQEMIPTELLLAIAGSRERVPFPSLMEMLFLEFSFELVREAGLRIPNIIGSTIGIVGAIILGQAAVQANIVSPILVVLVAITGLASFSIPYYSLAFAIRIYRFFYIILGALLGFYGITVGLFIQILLTTNLKSFGVPYLSPTGPRTYSGYDTVGRLPIFLQRRRPDYINPQDDTRAPAEPRSWINKKDENDE